jgi:TatD DNase family protein
MADAVLGLGFMISFAGNVTFKKAGELRAVALGVPPDRLLVETDCPYLAPVPLRGRRNEPAYVVETARFLAELRGTSAEELGRVTAENFARFFGVDLTE